MSLAGAPVESLTDQLNKQMAVLDSFYDRLGGFDPGTLPVTSQAVQPNPSVSTSAGAEDAGKAPCSRAVEDWSRNGEDPVQMDSPDFALLSEGERRNIILNRIAELNGLGETCFAQERNRIVDGAYSPAAEFAKELGITMLTTNLLGKKGNAITVLFNLDPADGGKPTCPLGKEITKTSTRANGSICVWMNQNHCSECPCNKDCGVKYQKRGELGTITLNPNTFQDAHSTHRGCLPGGLLQTAAAPPRRCRAGATSGCRWRITLDSALRRAQVPASMECRLLKGQEPTKTLWRFSISWAQR